ncbi:MAG TPA: UDP-3-O-(3-hydroxymyristoyl)glucosamine N-acyltransferase [Pyrinomonadaceae bacterium]|nr:UDP-3-O-(3-hydroxymyristoyl)glucosamine N-acyltransferase [Pyrinomonadaceae bacterium]
MKLAELAERTNARIEGDAEVEIKGAAGLDIAEAGDVTFLANKRYTPQVETTRASAIFVGEDAEIGRKDITVLRTRDPYLAYTRALIIFYPEPRPEPFIHPSAVIDPTAHVGEGVWIGANAVIGREAEIGARVRIHPNATVYDAVRIGDDSVIHSGVSLREGTILGKRVIVHNNTVVGSDGFGFAKDEEGRWLKIPQTGRVVVEDDVEIGANTAIDRASVGETRIGRGTKVDNLVQVGHSCSVGEDTLLCGQVGLAGSTKVGNRVILAGQVGVGGHLSIGDDAVLMAQAGVFYDVPPKSIYSGGIPAFDHKESLRTMAAIRKLTEMQRTLRTLEKRLKEVEAQLPATGKETS